VNPTPILIFAYNRPEHLNITLSALEHCRRLEECQVFIYCDGLKRAGDAENIEQTRKVAQTWGRDHRAKVILREENLGLRTSIITGVTEACDKFGRVIVLEDDIVVSPAFVSFMLEALDRYENEPRVYQAAGYLFSDENISKEDAFLIPVSNSWGWATWKRAWKTCNFNLNIIPEPFKSRNLRKEFDLGGAFHFSLLLENEINHFISTWAVLFYYHVFINKGLVVYPTHTLVYNNGFDSSGINSGDFNINPIAITDLKDLGAGGNFVFPKDISVNPDTFGKHRASMKKSYQKLYRKHPTLLIRLKTILFLRKNGLYEQAKTIFHLFGKRRKKTPN
jgi:hypothetical protein